MRTLILGTAGHIDHGKTALVRALTGTDTDRLPDEQRRGITIDIGFASLDLDGLALGIVDVPGHERFIKNMLAGASGVDVAMLVIAADDSVMPQTREHLAILQLLGVEHGLVVLSKADRVEPDWIELVRDDVRELVAGTFLEGAPIVATSAHTGDGLAALREALESTCAAIDTVSDDGPFRLAIDRAFMKTGLGTIVTGTVWSGELNMGDELDLWPSGTGVQVRGLETHGNATERVGRGQRAAVNLGGVHHGEVARGDVLATPGWLRATRRITVRLRALDDSPWPIRDRASVRLHLGTAEIMADVRLPETPALDAGETGWCQLVLHEPATATARQPFVIRAASPLQTIGGGHVVEPAPARPLRRRHVDHDRLERLLNGDDRERAGEAVFGFGLTAWSALDVCRDADLWPSVARQLVDGMRDAGRLIELPISAQRRLTVDARVVQRLEQRVLRSLERAHHREPLLARVPQTHVLRALPDVDRPVVDRLIARLVDRGLVAADDTGVALAAYEPALSETQEKLRIAVIETFAEAALAPPDLDDLARTLDRPQREVAPIVELCVSQGELMHLGGGLFLDRTAEQSLREQVREPLGRGDGLTVAQLRDIWGTSRKYAVPFTEYLDRIGMTRRVGDRRLPGPHLEKTS